MSDNWREIAIVLKQLRDLATRKQKFLLQLDQSISTHTQSYFYSKARFRMCSMLRMCIT